MAVLLGLTATAPAGAQQVLTLDDAMARARTVTPASRSAAALEREAVERVRQARAGYLPRVDLAEAVQRGNQPVFVFGSLLSQRRFTAGNFAIENLNRPEPVTNVRTSVGVEQAVFDGGATRLAVRGAEVRRDLAAASRTSAQSDLAFAAARAFVGVLQAEATLGATQSAVEAADSDVTRARARRDSGLVTEADVLAAQVHLAEARLAQMSAAAEVRVARLQLGEAIGEPLDDAVVLQRPQPIDTGRSIEELVQQALSSRAERQLAILRERAAATDIDMARAAFLPRVGAQAAWESNGASFIDQRASWVVGAEFRLNLFRGFSDRAHLAEARIAGSRLAAERERTERAIEVEVRSVAARLDAARARADLGRDSLAQASESRRIVRDRYDAGLAGMTDLLRAAEAVAVAEAHATAADLDVVMQRLMLERAVGGL